MIEMSILNINIDSLKRRDSLLVNAILAAEGDTKTYIGIKKAKDGVLVPILANNTVTNSLYNSHNEALSLLSPITQSSFVFFAGLGSGLHLKNFLQKFPQSFCCVCEPSYGAFLDLFSLIDFSEIIDNHRVSFCIIEDLDPSRNFLAQIYLPAIHGDFNLISLRPWESFLEKSYKKFIENIQAGLKKISLDFSVQSHFGKIWFKNILANLKYASQSPPKMPMIETSKNAVIVAAGPSLDSKIDFLRSNRTNLVVFSTDTAYPVLFAHGIIPDFFVSIDPQIISANHVFYDFSKQTTIIVDVCASPFIAKKALSLGCNLIVASGSHPLGLYASLFSKLPHIFSSGGTVTLAALDIAKALNFSSIQLLGADFAYTDGKAYAKGSYLDFSFEASHNRMSPIESKWVNLMFRTAITKEKYNNKITYKTEQFNFYSEFCASYQSTTRWNLEDFNVFPYLDFVSLLKKSIYDNSFLETKDSNIFKVLMPLMSWYQKKMRENNLKYNERDVFILALELIARYN